MNQIEWTAKARKQLMRLDKRHRIQVYDATGKLNTMPICANVKKLTNHKPQYRLRVGNYRVLFDFYQTIKIVKIEKVLKRDERTYN